jgi:nicotinate-nucleotide adenylyltransferase
MECVIALKNIDMKVGLFFGSFNPVHVGHMMLSQYVIEHTDLDQIWFIVSPQNPFKEENGLLDKRDRLDMVQMAILSDERMRVSDIEFDMPVPSYSCDTLRKLTELHPDNQFHLLLGTDTHEQIKTWKEPEYVSSFPKYVYPRFIDGTFHHTWGMKTQGNATYVEAPLMQLSSTFIRKSIVENKNVSYFLPTIVWDYIKHKGFYR